jgi:hypothetical protein
MKTIYMYLHTRHKLTGNYIYLDCVLCSPFITIGSLSVDLCSHKYGYKELLLKFGGPKWKCESDLIRYEIINRPKLNKHFVLP